MKIAVAGTGYVGMSLAVLLAQNHKGMAGDNLSEKVNLINRRISPIQDAEIEQFLAEEDMNLKATLDGQSGYRDVG